MLIPLAVIEHWKSVVKTENISKLAFNSQVLRKSHNQKLLRKSNELIYNLKVGRRPAHHPRSGKKIKLSQLNLLFGFASFLFNVFFFYIFFSFENAEKVITIPTLKS